MQECKNARRPRYHTRKNRDRILNISLIFITPFDDINLPNKSNNKNVAANKIKQKTFKLSSMPNENDVNTWASECRRGFVACGHPRCDLFKGFHCCVFVIKLFRKTCAARAAEMLNRCRGRFISNLQVLRQLFRGGTAAYSQDRSGISETQEKVSPTGQRSDVSTLDAQLGRIEPPFGINRFCCLKFKAVRADFVAGRQREPID